ncbi:MAG TPA: alkaline phosphatase family protein [Thermoanaerobaculia bacterium]|nr:alkaline phosphatase family protein [Thermoanaerobaculia bacterium]
MRSLSPAFALTASLLAFLACNRPAEAPSRPPRPAAAVEDSDVASRARRPVAASRPVLWLGLDGFDFEMVDRLASEGKMPNWKRLSSEGYTARLKSFLPLISPILWTTAATGVGPEVHRVLDFQEVDPKTGRKVPISGLSRQAPAVWNIASAKGRKVGVVGWWASHPAEEVNGYFVSDRASPILFDRSLPGAAFPASLEAGVKQVADRDGRVSDLELTRFLGIRESAIAAARSSGAGMEDPAVALSRILVATRVSQRVARDLYDRERPDLAALYLEGTDEVGHVFALATPPKLPCVSEADIARYGRAVLTYYGVIDRMLGQWMRRAEEDGATLVVHSDHGFKWGEDRPCGFASGDWKTAAFWHRMDGVFAAWGARAVSGRPRGEASIFDVAPTVLALLDLPADKRMRGKPIATGFRDLPAAQPKEDFSRLEVRRLAGRAPTEAESGEFAKKLRALGYLSGSEAPQLAPPGGDRPGLTEGGWNNLGVYLRDTARDPIEARQAFAKALSLKPDYYSPMFNLAVLERGRGDARAAEEWFFRSLFAAGADAAPAVLGWSHEYQKEEKTAAAKSLLERAARTYPGNESIALDLALLRYREKDCRGAVAALQTFEAATQSADTLNALAQFETCLQDRRAVIRLLERSLAVKPDQPALARLLERLRAAGS